MKAAIDVKDRRERDAIVCALADPETRAHVVIMGLLRQVKGAPARARLLDSIAEHITEDGKRAEAVMKGQQLAKQVLRP